MQNLLLILVVVFPALCAALCWFVPALRPDKARDGFVLVSLIVTLALVIGLCTTGDGMMTLFTMGDSLPVVLASGYSHVLAQESAEGFELLHKPYSADQVSRILRQVLGRGRRRPREVS